jgi:hypothetical protein
MVERSIIIGRQTPLAGCRQARPQAEFKNVTSDSLPFAAGTFGTAGGAGLTFYAGGGMLLVTSAGLRIIKDRSRHRG